MDYFIGMSIAIVGHKGYIGSFLNSKLSPAGAYDHHDGDREVFRESLSLYDVVIYLGGLSGRKSCSDSASFRENVEDIMDVAARMKPGALLIYASTASLYEGFGAAAPDETAMLNTQLFDNYTYSMYLREKNVQTLSHIHTIGLRLGTVIGLSPNQRRNLVHTAMLRQAVLNGAVRVFGANQNRAIVWTEDLHQIVKTIIDRRAIYAAGKHTIYNVASFNCTVAKIANQLACMTGCNTLFEADDETVKYNIGFSMNTDKIRRDLGVQFTCTNKTLFEDLMRDLEHVCWSAEYLRKWETVPCRVCKREAPMRLIYNFGNQPNANHYLKDPAAQLPEYPLQLCVCTDCWHTQIPYTIPPEQMFSDYVYLSGTSNTMREFFSDFAEKSIQKTGVSAGNVLELACNDGSLLNQYKSRGWKTFGYDPARNLHAISSAAGHDVTVGFWGQDPVPEYPELDLIVAQNVCAHVPDPVAFLSACRKVMGANTTLYVQTSQANMIELGQFDTAYHEHMSFFTAKSMKVAAELAGLQLCEVEKVAVHGTSYIFTIRLPSPDNPDITESEIYLYETSIGLYDKLMYYVYVEKIKRLKVWILDEVRKLANKGVKVVGYGAAAKGMTILNYIGGIREMEYIADDSPVKHGYYATNNAYLITPPATLAEHDGPMAVIVFAWNFISEICDKIKNIRAGKETYLLAPYPRNTMLHISREGEVRKLYEEVDTRYNRDSLFHKNILISHFYNEDALLTQWIRHHASMFDCAVLINHKSTDASVAVARREMPESWNIVDTWLPDFCAMNTDIEVAGYENSFSNNDWRLALTTTEFLFAAGFRRRENRVFTNLGSADAIRISSVSLIDSEQSRINPSASILQQRSKYYFKEDSGEEPTEEERYLGNHYNRFMHRTRTMTNPYVLGRHQFRFPSVDKPLYIMKLLYSPYPEFYARKLQIRNRMAQSNIDEKWGFQHMMDFEEMRTKYERLSHFPLADISEPADQLRFFNQYMKQHSGEQLLCGIYNNLYPGTK